jgi:hypothetical protein
MSNWLPIETAPRDGREILGYEDGVIRVCRPKEFPRPFTLGDDMSMSKPGDRWEWFRDDEFCPNHTWSMEPTHWMPLPAPPPMGEQR